MFPTEIYLGGRLIQISTVFKIFDNDLIKNIKWAQNVQIAQNVI